MARGVTVGRAPAQAPHSRQLTKPASRNRCCPNAQVSKTEGDAKRPRPAEGGALRGRLAEVGQGGHAGPRRQAAASESGRTMARGMAQGEIWPCPRWAVPSGLPRSFDPLRHFAACAVTLAGAHLPYAGPPIALHLPQAADLARPPGGCGCTKSCRERPLSFFRAAQETNPRTQPPPLHARNPEALDHSAAFVRPEGRPDNAVRDDRAIRGSRLARLPALISR